MNKELLLDLLRLLSHGRRWPDDVVHACPAVNNPHWARDLRAYLLALMQSKLLKDFTEPFTFLQPLKSPFLKCSHIHPAPLKNLSMQDNKNLKSLVEWKRSKLRWHPTADKLNPCIFSFDGTTGAASSA
eukprot:1160232-Pelagomonas_calceolata.AAC.7